MKQTVLCLSAVAFLAAPTVRAQMPARPEWGGQASVAFNGGSDFGLGGRVRYPFRLTAPAPIWAAADLNWFPGSTTVFDLNWNLAYGFVPHSTLIPYAGGGVNLRLANGTGSNLKFGLNAIGGFDLGRLGQLQPYLEGRYTFFSLDAFVVTFGVRF